MARIRQEGLLLIVAHPDDEFFCAGALAALGRKNIPVHVVYWTRGEGGCRSRFRPLYLPFPFLNPRIRETKKSLDGLRVSGWQFLNYIDPRPKSGLRAPAHDKENFQVEIRSLIRKYRPLLVLSHGSNGEYGHPAHVALHQNVAAALKNDAKDPGLITFGAAHPDPRLQRMQNPADSPDMVLDASPFSAQKLAVLKAHASQKKVWKNLIPEAGDSLEKVIELTKLEYYHCAGVDKHRDAHTGLFKEWTGSHSL